MRRIGVLLVMGLWACVSSAQEPPRVVLPTQLQAMDNLTYVMPMSEGHQLCWGNGNAGTDLEIRFYRYRLEGGPRTLYLRLPFALWVEQPVRTNYCTSGTHRVPKSGHWIYEAEICRGSGANWTCSIRVSAACPAGSAETCSGMVAGDVPRGWWVYAYLPTPTGGEVD